MRFFAWIKRKIVWLVLGGIALAAVPSLLPEQTRPLHERIDGLSAIEKAIVKSQELGKIGAIGRTQRSIFDIEVVAIESVGFPKSVVTKERAEWLTEDFQSAGVVLYARVWASQSWEPFIDSPEGQLIQKGEQIGFGKDGTVDIERFVFINPPILVDDPNGPIVRSWVDEDTQETKTRRLREDPKEAILQSLEHTIFVKQEKHGSGGIVAGKIGNTTTTVYPDPDPETTSIDARIFHVEFAGAGTAWATLIATNGDSVDSTGTTLECVTIEAGTDTNKWAVLGRCIILFDTSSIPDTDTISSATLSIFGNSKTDGAVITPDINIYSSSPASNTAVVSGDMDDFGATAYSTAITYANWSTSAYNDFALNASGLTNISKTGVSKFGARNAAYDGAAVAPTWSIADVSRVSGKSADTAGTTSDPKFVIEHSTTAAPASQPPQDMIIFSQASPYFSPADFIQPRAFTWKL